MPIDEQIALTREQVRQVDRRAIEEYGVPGIVLMENAARNAATLILEALAGWEGTPRPRPVALGPGPGVLGSGPGALGDVAIVCGRGNNGGDGFAIARHLTNAGIDVALFLTCDPQHLSGDAATNYRIARRMSVPCHAFDTPEHIEAARPRLDRATLIVDAILGTGFSGRVRPPTDRAIEAIGAVESARVVAIDVPSGLDCDTGRPSNATVRADMTITFVARKVGFAAPGAADYTGTVHVADIGAPGSILQAVLSSTTSG